MARNLVHDHRIQVRDELDHRMMSLALARAKGGEGHVEPNPMVGCVIVRAGEVIGEGYHRRFGGAHAEIEALRCCRTNPAGATAYVTLEPCCHHGKTPPCTDALIEAKISRVVAGCADPNPLVKGRGFRQLRKHGVEVSVGTMAREAEELLRPYLTRVIQHRPYVIAKWAQSLDGRMTTGPGGPRWISSPESRCEGHQLRSRVDAIVVGSGTVLTDNPMLTARKVRVIRRAARVIVDSRLRTPMDCRLVRTALNHSTILFTSPANGRSRKADRLRKSGVEVIGIALQGRSVSLKKCLTVLYHRGMTNLLVEGGATILRSLHRGGLIDEAYIYTAPIFLSNGSAPTILVCDHASKSKRTPAPRLVSIRTIDCDVCHHFRLTATPHRKMASRTE